MPRDAKRGRPKKKQEPEPESSYVTTTSTTSSSDESDESSGLNVFKSPNDPAKHPGEESSMSSLVDALRRAKENLHGEANFVSEEEVVLAIDGGIVRYPAKEKDRNARKNITGWKLALGDGFMRHGSHTLASALLTEFLASLFAAFFFLLFVGHLLWTGFFGVAPNVLMSVVVFALAYGACMWFAAPYSGGIVNPLIALTVLLTGHMSVARAIAYMIVEVFGAVLGAIIARATLGWTISVGSSGDDQNTSDDTSSTPSSLALRSIEYIQTVTCGVHRGGGSSEKASYQQFAFELVMTWAFLLLVYTAAFGKQTRAKVRSPLAVAIIAAAYASMAFISTSVHAGGGSFFYVWKGNPALCFATSIAGFREGLEDSITYEDWTWIFGSLLGAVLASVVVLFLRPWKRRPTWPVVDNARV